MEDWTDAIKKVNQTQELMNIEELTTIDLPFWAKCVSTITLTH